MANLPAANMMHRKPRAWAGLVLALAWIAVSAQAPAPTAKTSASLESLLRASRAGDAHAVLVYFRDKGTPAAARAAAREVSPRALQRRALRGRPGALAAAEELPLADSYVRAVEARALRLRQRLVWLNAVSALATREQIAELQALPFVARIDVVRRFRRGPPEPFVDAGAAAASSSSPSAEPHALDYGSSLGQLQQLGVPALHDRGYNGEGVIVAVLDAGFDNLGHEVFGGLRVLGMRDFVNNDDDVGNGRDRGEGSHGTATLSVLGGFRQGELIGPAYNASFLLAKTEDTESETHVEEDNWAAAAEWAEGLGADVISSSLGYLEFDRGQAGYTFADMDGKTALVTRAAELAAARGVVVVNSAGNEGFHASHNTLGAPADGSHVLAVAAVTSGGTRASFSSVGPSADGRIKPDVAAQGQSVKVAGSSAREYRLASGTSFSCPLTAGVVALVLQAHPEFSADDVLAVMRGSARRAATPDNLLGYGIVDAAAAVDSRRP
jgi:subtilisin family serine protease